jgi:hypothetical protein
MLPLDSNRPAIKQWQTQVLDRFLAYNGLEEAECLCVENGEPIQHPYLLEHLGQSSYAIYMMSMVCCGKPFNIIDIGVFSRS